MKHVYILFNNDSPELAYFDEVAAESEAKKRQVAGKREAKEGYPTCYWHVHTVAVAEAK